MILPSASHAGGLLSLAAAAAYAATATTAGRLPDLRTRGLLWLAWLLHAAVLAMGLVAGTPRFGFAPALSMTAWLVLTVYVLEQHHFPQLQLRWPLAALGGLALVLAWAFPGQALHATASAWLPLHLALGIACYGLFAAAVVHAWLMGRTDRLIRKAANAQGSLPLLTLERLTFRFVTAGFVLLTAALLAGMLFGEVLYDRPWRWDHKAVFSLLSWLTFAALLLGRVRFGWRGRSAARVLYVGTGLLLLAYAGTRFVAEVVLGRGA